MYILTSNTPNDISLEVTQDGVQKVIHLDKKFSTAKVDELTDKIIYLDSKDIVKYSEVLNEVKEVEEPRRHRRRNQSIQNTEEVSENSDDSSNDETN